MKRKFSLDVVKVIATIVIIFHHYQQLTGAYFESGINFYNGSFYWGLMVELFFLISGYFTWHHMEKVKKDSRFGDFFIKKYLRFLPMLMIAGLVTIIVEYVYYVQLCDEPFYYTLWGLIIGLLGFTRWLGCGVTVNNPMWYISVLLLCYTVFYLSTWAARKIQASPYYFYIITVIIGIVMKNLCETGGYCWPLFSGVIGRGYSCFFGGVILKNICERYRLKEKSNVAIIAGIWLVTFIYFFRYKQEYIGEDLWNILCFMVYPAIIIIFENEKIERMFSSNKLKNLAGVSFNAYLWHYPVIIMVLIIKEIYLIDLNQALVMGVVTIGIFGVGDISWKYIESPVREKVDAYVRKGANV